MNKIILFTVFIFLCALPSLNRTVSASDSPYPYTASPAHDFAFEFYHKSDQKPNFEQWALSSQLYKDAADFDKDFILKQQTSLLSDSFYNYRPGQLLNISTFVTLDNYSEIQQAFFIPQITEESFFSYDVFDQNFMVIIPDIETFGKITVENEDKKDFMIAKARTGRTSMEFIIRIVRTDTSQSYLIKDKERWLMQAELLEVKLWSHNKRHLLWSDKKDNFSPPNRLENLYYKK